MNLEMLPCVLTTEERAARAQELATHVRKLDEEETAAKSAASAARDTIKEMEAELRRLARIVREGREEREVEIRSYRDLDEKLFLTIRLDTGERIRQRALSMEELQIPLHLVDDGDSEASR